MESFFNNLPNNISHIKIDVGLGMCNGNSLDWLQTDTNMCLICFEPNIDSKNSCINHITNISNKINNNNNAVFIETVALSNVKEATKLNFYSMLEDGGTSSLYKPSDESLGPVKCETMIDVYSLKHFFDLFPWNRFNYIDYIKIDAQGADFDIIKSAGNYLKDKVVFITAEPESDSYIGCNHNTSENMTEYLKTQGFERINHPNTSDPTFLNNKYRHLYDKIYIRQR
jgi:FkbM family methyltransferase